MMDVAGRYWRSCALALAQDVLSLADDAGMPDSYRETDSRVQRARNALTVEGGER